MSWWKRAKTSPESTQRHSTEEAENNQKQRPVTGFKHIRLLPGNGLAHASEIVTVF